ncbi:MAG: outer membrane protein assembly factor BamC [Cardiobacteriaceae bacterium]|nr:outer membrane protein assembly factor BamC [Cardiobacteriaceae bacterium]
MRHITLVTTALLLTACSGGNLTDLIPDRRPDYRQSRMNNALEIPPDLSAASLDDKLTIPDLNPATTATYSAYAQDNAVRDRRGYIQVLPELQGVRVVENAGELPYLVVNADASTAWQAVTRYWHNNGIRLKVSDPAIGLMETDWLENKADLPSTGVSGLLNSLLGFISDSGKRDRYRIRFAKLADNQTSVTLVYSQAEERPEGNPKEPSGYRWTQTDNDNPELQLEMTRRLALYIDAEMRRAQNIQQSGNKAAARSTLTSVAGQPALALAGSYEQAWRNLGIGLDRASFRILSDTYATGTYEVRYEPQADEAKKQGSFWSRLWGGKAAPKGSERPVYHVRLASDQGRNLAVVQNASGQNAPDKEARAVLETIASVL